MLQTLLYFSKLVNITVFLLLCMLSSLFAQEGAEAGKLVDSSAIYKKREYIKPMGDYITLRLSMSSEIDALSQSTESPTGETVRYDIFPNVGSVLRLNFAYRFISFGFSFSPKFLPGNGDEDLRGKTKSGGFGFGFSMNHWQQELGYNKIKGYYLDNTKDFRPGWQDGDEFIQFPDLNFLSFHGLTGYKFNSNYSFNAVISASERQLKSAGTFMPSLTYRYYIIDDRSGSAGAQKSKNFEALIHAGYYHTFVLQQKFYLSLGLNPGIGYLFSNFKVKNDPSINGKQTNFIAKIKARAGLGYNGERVAAGVYTTLGVSEFNQSGTSVVNDESQFFYNVFFAYRLPAPKFLKDMVDWGVAEAKGLLPKKKDAK